MPEIQHTYDSSLIVSFSLAAVQNAGKRAKEIYKGKTENTTNKKAKKTHLGSHDAKVSSSAAGTAGPQWITTHQK